LPGVGGDVEHHPSCDLSRTSARGSSVRSAAVRRGREAGQRLRQRGGDARPQVRRWIAEYLQKKNPDRSWIGWDGEEGLLGLAAQTETGAGKVCNVGSLAIRGDQKQIQRFVCLL
jgi:hypothetical protein